MFYYKGIGSFLGGLFRAVWPIIKSGASTVGKETLKTAANILTDVSEQKNLKQAVSNRTKEGVTHLTKKFVNKMNGNGIKSATRTTGKRKRKQSSVITQTREKQSQNKKKKANKNSCFRDIFTQ